MSLSLWCTECNNKETRVTDSRVGRKFSGDICSAMRRRRCIKCGHKFTTYEVPAEYIVRLESLFSTLSLSGGNLANAVVSIDAVLRAASKEASKAT